MTAGETAHYLHSNLKKQMFKLRKETNLLPHQATFVDFQLRKKSVGLFDERWAQVPGYPDYLISTYGEVWSFKVRHGKTGSKMTLDVDRFGYLKVALRNEKGSKRFMVHRLVLMAFVGPSHLETNHRNKDRKDNYLGNLEYVTSKENNLHRSSGKKRGVYFFKGKWMAMIRKDGLKRYIGSFTDKEEAYMAFWKEYKAHHGKEPWCLN